MEYTLPKIKDLRIDKLEYFDNIKNVRDITKIGIRDIVKINSSFTGLEESFLLTVTKQSNIKLAKEIEKLINTIVFKAQKTSFTFNKQKYVLHQDLRTMPTAFWVDLSNQDIEKNPIRMASSIYIEEGMKYSEMDENKNIINPVSKRDEIFKEHLPLQEYINIQGFFLTKYNELTPIFMEANQLLNLDSLTDGVGIK